MNTVLTQEVIRYSRLIVVMHKSLDSFKLAVAGKVVMSDELEAMGHAMIKNDVPPNWGKTSFLSLKPLSS